MNKDKYVFAQLIEFLDNNKFRHSVDKYDGNRYVKHFTYKYKDEKYHFAWQTWGYVDMYDNNWNKLFDLYYKKYGEGFNIAIDDQSDHDSSYYIRMIEDCIERYVKFKGNHTSSLPVQQK